MAGFAGPFINANQAIIYNGQQVFTGKRLTPTKHFQDELLIYSPDYLHRETVAICMHKGEVITLHNELEEYFLNTYSLQGALLKSVRCTFNEYACLIPATDAREMICCDGDFY